MCNVGIAMGNQQVQYFISQRKDQSSMLNDSYNKSSLSETESEMDEHSTKIVKALEKLGDKATEEEFEKLLAEAEEMRQAKDDE